MEHSALIDRMRQMPGVHCCAVFDSESGAPLMKSETFVGANATLVRQLVDALVTSERESTRFEDSTRKVFLRRAGAVVLALLGDGEIDESRVQHQFNVMAIRLKGSRPPPRQAPVNVERFLPQAAVADLQSALIDQVGPFGRPLFQKALVAAGCDDRSLTPTAARELVAAIGREVPDRTRPTWSTRAAGIIDAAVAVQARATPSMPVSSPPPSTRPPPISSHPSRPAPPLSPIVDRGPEIERLLTEQVGPLARILVESERAAMRAAGEEGLPALVERLAARISIPHRRDAFIASARAILGP